MRFRKIFWLPIIIVLAGGYFFYRSAGGVSVSDFHPFVNYKSKANVFMVDLSDAVYRGIEIPTVKQLPGGKFVFSFKAKNKGFSKKLYYKIFYQNETYKYPEFEEKNKFKYPHPFSTSNFYGSWGEVDAGFKATGEIGWNGEAEIRDSFRIVGNPRNEQAYFGRDDQGGISAVSIANMINYMRSREDWIVHVSQKAKMNGITVDQQLYRDAVWQVDDMRGVRETNNRWKRNPRTGNYRFLIVVTTEGGMNGMPKSIRDISKMETDKTFINPFYYFLYGAGSIDKNVAVAVAEEQLNVKAVFSPGKGIYVNPFEFLQSGIDTGSFCATCATDSVLYRQAQFSQYFSSEDKSQILPTIPVAYDVTGDNYTYRQYLDNRDTYSPEGILSHPEQLVRDYIHNSSQACQTVKADPVTNSISIFNPGNDTLPYRKENVGVRSRIGFTYGKFRVCAQFPELLSDDHVWNGLSNSIWLLYQEELPWNRRSSCSTGFIPKDDPRGAKAQRVSAVNYSEIDMEMVKSSRNWPHTSYGEAMKPDDDQPAFNDEVIIACSNWDLGCMQPKHYVTGVMPLAFQNRTFELHRWDSWYRALTIKTPENDNELFRKPFYWYEIEWTPEHIIWRVGPDKNHLRIVGYMNREYTMIPDNQMSLIISQKFPDSNWWTPAPYDQRYIPYPKNPLRGKILAVEVE